MKLSSLKINSAALEQGRWIGDLPQMGDLRLKVRGIPNADWRRLQPKLVQAVPAAKRLRGIIDPDQMDMITTELLVETVLIDWSGLTDDADAALPFSKDAARTLLSNPDYRPFREAVMSAAGLVGEEDAVSAEIEAKN